MENWLFIPPVTFGVVLFFVWLKSLWLKPLSFRPAGEQPAGKYKAYACGEDVKDHQGAPVYGEFFQFAFFFTILHVIALIVATVPSGSIQAACLAVAFILSAAVGLFILFRRS